MKIPFVTNILVHDKAGHKHVLAARTWRKGLFHAHRRHTDLSTDTPVWKTRWYNRAIGQLFAIGAFLFALASALSFGLSTSTTGVWLCNLLYFMGSIPFTAAASLQHIQSANADHGDEIDPNTGRKASWRLIGWAPKNAGWWSTFLQWLGTIAFNVSTFSAIRPPPEKALDTLLIWEQDVEGSVLFLVSGYLAFVEVSHRFFSWKPKDSSWRVVFVNLLGCVAFMIAALTPTSLSGKGVLAVLSYSTTYTFLGAVFFFWGAILSIKESDAADI